MEMRTTYFCGYCGLFFPTFLSQYENFSDRHYCPRCHREIDTDNPITIPMLLWCTQNLDFFHGDG